MDYKNKLQEYFQKGGFDLPQYGSIQNNDLTWRSSVTFSFEGVSYSIDSLTNHPKKRDAEKSAAEIAYKHLFPKQEIITYKKFNPSQTTHIMLIDIENCPNLLKVDVADKVHKFGFIGQFSDHYQRKDMIKQFCDLRIINSSTNNAADINLTFVCATIVCQLQQTFFKPKFIIVSRDKFADVLRQIVSECGFEAYVVSTKDDLMEYLH